jgi:hypothetical protein
MLTDVVTLSGVLSFKVYDGVVSPETLRYVSPEFRNLVTTAGKNFFLQRANGTAVTALSGFLIGNGSTAAAVGDTALSGASKYRQAFDSVSTVGAVTTYTTTVAAGNATFVNNEFGVTNATTTAMSDGVLVTHLIAGPYTKAAPDVIVYVYALTQA